MKIIGTIGYVKYTFIFTIILSVYILMSFDFPFVRLFGVR